MSKSGLTSSENEYSLYSLTPESIQERLVKHEKLIGSFDSEKEWSKAGRITELDKKLRIRVWSLFRKSQENGKPITVTGITKGVCNRCHFNDIMDNPHRFSYIFTPTTDYEENNQLLLYTATEEMKEIMKLSNFDEKGKVITALVNAKIKLFLEMQNRVHGGAVQRIQSHQVNETVPSEAATPKAIEVELEEIRKLEEAIEVNVERK